MKILEIFLISFFLLLLFFFILYLIYRINLIFKIECNHIKIKAEPKLSKNKIIFRDGYEADYTKSIFLSSERIFILFHGLNSCSFELKNVEIFLKSKNESVINFNQRNWGDNKNVECYHFGTLIDDYYDLIKIAKKKYPKKKIVLIGHSMGAVVLNYLFKKYKNLNSEIKIIMINYPTKYFVDIDNFIFNKNKSFFHFFLNGLIFNKKIKLKFLNAESRKKIVKNKTLFIQNDIFVIRNLPFYFFTSFIYLMFSFKKTLSNNKKNKFLIFIGSKDEFTNWKTLNKHKKYFIENNKKNIKLQILKNVKHQCFFDKKLSDILLDKIYLELNNY